MNTISTSKTKVCFKTVMYGEFKGEVIAVINESRVNDLIDTFVLLEGHSHATISFLHDSTRNSTVQEYTATLNTMVRDYNYNIEVVRSISKVK